MHYLDALVLAGYFLMMIGIGIYASRRIKKQEDYFMGGRSFGKLLQTFAAFGAGTGSNDPVNSARTTFTSGMSGMWSVMYWLFVTPFYWITGVWYRRMRLLTLGDWFVERYESKALGFGYAIFGILFFMVYGSQFFSAIGKVAAPLMGASPDDHIEYWLVPVVAVVVLIYGIAGGLEAAYFTDLVQGLCVILLSIILIPMGLSALVQDAPEATSLLDGFRVMHERLPESHFNIIGSSQSEFPLHRILAVVLINLVGIVVQPHFIATGGGSAKTETNARVGLVVGNFLKRFCTVGWVLTALIALALYSNDPTLAIDPDQTWGVASRNLLPAGLSGLMLACLLAALMSSVDAYMVVGSGLVVRNIYAAYFNPNASEKEFLRVGRITGGLIVVGSVVISLSIFDMLAQLELTWVFPVLFAAPFWVGMYWRRATLAAAWTSVAFCALMFFVIPFLAPRLVPGLRENPEFLATNRLVMSRTTKVASPSEAELENQKRLAAWNARLQRAQGLEDPAQREAEVARVTEDKPAPIAPGDEFQVVSQRGGASVFWPGGVVPVDDRGMPLEITPQPVGDAWKRIDETTEEIELAYPEGTRFKGQGNFRLDFLMYHVAGMDLTQYSAATLDTLTLPPKIVTPFLVMILVSLFTRRNSQTGLDRYYAKMKTPVDPDPEADAKKLEDAYRSPERLEQRKLFPGTSLEFQKPTVVDVVGFVACVGVCFAIIWLAVWVAGIGA